MKKFKKVLCVFLMLMLLIAPGLRGMEVKAAADSVTVYSLSELQSAINNAPADGRIITLAAGTYNQTSTISVTGKNNITIQGATSSYNDTVIAGPGINNSNLWINIKVNDSKYCTIKNLTIKDSYYHAIQINGDSDYFYAYNLKTWDNGESGFKVTSPGTSGPYSDYGVIENCYIGFTTSGVRSVVEGVDIIASVGWVLKRNTVVNVKKPNGYPGYGMFAKGNAQNTVIERNLFIGCGIAISFGGGGCDAAYFRDGDTTYEHRNGIMRNNVVWGTTDTGIYMNKAYNAKVYNNTIWNGPGYTRSIEFRFAQTTGCDAKNNICRGTIASRDGGTFTESNNLTNASSALFVNEANGDFHLVSTATTAIDKGYNVGADVSVDYDGRTRPRGTAYDIGAFEY